MTSHINKQKIKIENEELNGLTGYDARPDVRARRVWRQGQNAFFDRWRRS